MKTLATLSVSAILLVCPALLRGDDKPTTQRTTLAELLKRQGWPQFTAQSTSIRHGRLSVTGFEMIDPAAVTSEQLKGRSLIFCNFRAALLLSGALMEGATPLLGHEGQARLLTPARILLVVTDKNGVVVRREAATVTELEPLQAKKNPR